MIWINRTIEYDTLGNRLAEIDLQTGSATAYQANSMNQYSYVDDELLEYDDNGNLEYDGDYYYFYDYENRLNRIEDHASDLIIRSYYDALGLVILFKHSSNRILRLDLFLSYSNNNQR